MTEYIEYDTTRVKAYMEQEGVKPMELVRSCGIATSTAYMIARGEPVKDLGVLYKVYMGLKQSGYSVTWVQLTGIE